jgi:hypothetical protein
LSTGTDSPVRGCLRDTHPCGLDETRIGGHGVPRLEQNQVARHQDTGLDPGLDARAHEARGERGEASEGGERALSTPFLEGPDHGVEEHHHRDDDRVARLPKDEGKRGRAEEQVDERVGELPGEDREQRARAGLGQRVRTVGLQAGLGEPRLDPHCGRGLELGADLFGGACMPRSRGLAGVFEAYHGKQHALE